MRVLTVGDAHLLGGDDPGMAEFVAWLDREAVAADLVVFNGDVFEFLVGRQRAAMRAYAPVLERMALLAEHRQVVVIEGNHDFHLRRVLPAAIEVAERFATTVGGVPTLWLHGDTIFGDRAYALLRWALRRRMVRLAVEGAPAPLIWRLAIGWASVSRQAQARYDTDDVRRHLPQAAAALRGAGAQRLFTGHLHAPLVTPIEDREWVAMGDWLSGRWYHELNDTNGELKQFHPK